MLPRIVFCALLAVAPVAATPSFAQVRGSSPYNETVKRFENREKPKIVGGVLSPDGARPWQVSLVVSWIGNPAEAHFCGGSIYDAKWIVTAAHCLTNLTPKDVNVVVGTNKLAPGVKRLNVARLLSNAKYKSTNHDQDIALIELRDPIDLGPRSKAIALIDSSTEPSLLVPEVKFLVSGWGATQEGADPVSTLREVPVPFINTNDCNDDLVYNKQVTDNMFCAGVLSGGQDSCQGDSGGPLVHGADTTNPILSGVVSWGEGCAREGKPGVYTRVAKYTDWVKQCVATPDSCQ